MNVAEVMQKVDGVWTQEAGAVVPAPMPDGSPEEMDIDSINIPLSNSTAVGITVYGDESGVISEAIKRFEESFDSSVVPLDVMNITAACKDLKGYTLVCYKGKQIAMNKEINRERVEDYVKKIQEVINQGNPYSDPLNVDVEYNGRTYTTWKLSTIETQEVLKDFSVFNARVCKSEHGINLEVAH